MAHNTTEPEHGGWHIEPFTAVYTSATGDAWLYLTGDLSPDSSALLVSCDTACADSTVKWITSRH